MLIMRPKNIGVVPMYDPDTSLSGRIIIPEVAKERVDQGLVAYVGAEVETVQVGDHVIFSGYTGTTLTIEGKQLIVFEEQFVSAIIHDDPINISGLFFRDASGEYFEANSEDALRLIARNYEQNPIVRSRNKVSSRPKAEEVTWR